MDGIPPHSNLWKWQALVAARSILQVTSFPQLCDSNRYSVPIKFLNWVLEGMIDNLTSDLLLSQTYKRGGTHESNEPKMTVLDYELLSS